MKGFDFYNQLDEFVGENDEFTFTYIGREIGSFKNTNVVEPLFGEALEKSWVSMMYTLVHLDMILDPTTYLKVWPVRYQLMYIQKAVGA